jgi:hypothetical protein
MTFIVPPAAEGGFVFPPQNTLLDKRKSGRTGSVVNPTEQQGKTDLHLDEDQGLAGAEFSGPKSIKGPTV